MTRPDPRSTARRPMAAAQRAVAYRPAAPGAGRPLLTSTGAVDLDAVHAALEAADAAVEGGRYLEAVPTFAGTVVFDLIAPDAAIARAALILDPRVAEAVRGHVHRAVAGLLGPDTPHALEVDLRITQRGAGLRLSAEVEGALLGGAVSAAQ